MKRVTAEEIALLEARLAAASPAEAARLVRKLILLKRKYLRQ